MLAAAILFAQLLALTATASSTVHPNQDRDPIKLADSTIEPGNGTTPINTRGARGSYYCEWNWWSSQYWWGLNEVKYGKAKSFRKCALDCCKNPYCATFDWNKKRKMCYQYNENINDYLEYYDNSPDWKSGAMTYKNGYSYI